MLFYRAALPLSHRTLNYVASVVRRHRSAIGSHWRRLNPGQQALLVLVHWGWRQLTALRHKQKWGLTRR